MYLLPQLHRRFPVRIWAARLSFSCGWKVRRAPYGRKCHPSIHPRARMEMESIQVASIPYNYNPYPSEKSDCPNHFPFYEVRIHEPASLLTTWSVARGDLGGKPKSPS